MALVKCAECQQEISTKATVCPHCGKPNLPVVIEQTQDGDGKWTTNDRWTATIGFLLIGLLFVGLYFWSGGVFGLNLSKLGNIDSEYKAMFPQTQAPSGHEVALQEVNNLGYKFYVGEIESAGATNITDDLKNQITKIAYTAQFPTSLLKNVPIIILNNLALTGDQYISVPAGNLKVPDLKPDFLSEGGIYVTFNSGAAVIFINKPIVAQGQLTEVLTHELGHAVGSKLTDQDWAKFYQLRGIPTGTVRHGTNWNLSPEEDFAEVYKNVFTGIPVRTYYGQLTPSIADVDISSCMTVYIDAENRYTPKSEADPNDPSAWLKAMSNPPKVDYAAVSAQANADSKVQACRKNVMMDPSSHQSDWAFGVPYKSYVGPATKTFIIGIASRLNQK